MHMSSTRRRTTGWLIAIATLAAFALRYWFFRTASIDRPVRGDALDYVSYAANLIQYHVFSIASGGAPRLPDSYRDPGYPLFLVPFISFIHDPGLRYWAVQFIQSLLGSLTVTAYLLLARRWLNTPWLTATAALLVVWPHSITMPAYVLSETLLGFLVAAGLALLGEGMARKRMKLLIGGALVFGCAGITNAVVAPFLPIAAAIGWMARPERRRQCMTILLTSLLIPACWTIRNITLVQGPTANSRAMTNLVQGSWPEYHPAWLAALGGDPAAEAMSAQINNDVALATRDRDAGLAGIATRLRQAPLHYATWYASKPWLLWSWSYRIASGHIYIFPTQNSPLESSDIAWYSMQGLIALTPWIAALALMACGLAMLGMVGEGPVWAAGLLIYITLVYGIFQSEPRYATPFRGAEMVLAVTAAAWLSTVIRPAIAGVRTWKPRPKVQ